MNKYVKTTKSQTIWDMMKWAQNLLEENHRPDAEIDARLLMQHILDVNFTNLLLDRQKNIETDKKEKYINIVKKRAQGIPLQHLTHKQEFMGLEFYVDENVLIPRQDTETLVETVLSFAKSNNIKTGIDIGTGSGCIGISLAHYLPQLKMTLLDISEEALKIADYNVKMHELTSRITTLKSDMLSQYTGDKVDIIVSNPPYISIKDMSDLMTEVKDHEPHIALTDGGDGLSYYRKITVESKKYLQDGGLLAYEIGYDEGKSVKEIMEKAGYRDIMIYKDLAGKDRVVTGKYSWSGL